MISVFGFGPDTDKSKVENETLQFRARARENFGNPSYVDGGSYVLRPLVLWLPTLRVFFR
jgi:hypothetical protein